MSTFDKSAVDVAELGREELERVLRAAGFATPGVAFEKLTNGGCAANYVARWADDAVVVKACPGSGAEALARQQLAVLEALERSQSTVGPRPRYGADVGLFNDDRVIECTTTRGLKAWAIVMDLLPGEPVNLLLRAGRVEGPAAFGALGRVLAALHATVAPPAGASDVADASYVERYVRCAAPFEGAVAEAWARVDGAGDFVTWTLVHLAEARSALRDATLRRGLLHGDPYTDNVLLLVGAGGAAALVDWEDACVGPCAFDLACALVGGCFDGDGNLDAATATAMLRAYDAVRSLDDPAETRALRLLMRANALATAMYRWHAFNVVDAGNAEARTAHVEMRNIHDALREHDGPATKILHAAVQTALHSKKTADDDV